MVREIHCLFVLQAHIFSDQAGRWLALTSLLVVARRAELLWRIHLVRSSLGHGRHALSELGVVRLIERVVVLVFFLLLLAEADLG